MKHINSHNLHQGNIVVCIKSKDAVYGSYFVKDRKYEVIEEYYNQTEYHEIFLLDKEFEGATKYIKDSEFKEHFELDIKELRKQKLNKIGRQ